jgi:hypothetical protein
MIPNVPLTLALVKEIVAMRAHDAAASFLVKVRPGDTAFKLSDGKCAVQPALIYPGQTLNTRLCIVTPAMPFREGSNNRVIIVTPAPTQTPPVQLAGSDYYGTPGPQDAAIGALWESAGGPASQASTAECIAWHESGDRINAISPSDDSGLWQINIVNAPTLAMENPVANAEEAVHLWEDDGWSPWTTAPDCGA